MARYRGPRPEAHGGQFEGVNFNHLFMAIHHREGIRTGPESRKMDEKLVIEGCEVKEVGDLRIVLEGVDWTKYSGQVQTPQDLERVLYGASATVRADMEASENKISDEHRSVESYQQEWNEKLYRIAKILQGIDLEAFQNRQTSTVDYSSGLMEDLRSVITEWRGVAPEKEDLVSYLKTVCDILSAEYVYFVKNYKERPVLEDPKSTGAEASPMLAWLAGKSKDVEYIQQHPTEGTTLYKVYRYMEDICRPKLERLIDLAQSPATANVLDPADIASIRDQILGVAADSLIYEMPIGVGTRNRFQIAKKIMKDALVRQLKAFHSKEQKEDSLIVVSYAAGSGLAVNEAMAEAIDDIERIKKAQPEKYQSLELPPIELYFIDLDPDSLSFARKVADEDLKLSDHGVQVNTVVAKRNDVKNPDFISSVLNGRKAGICEAVGIADYLDQNYYRGLVENLNNATAKGGLSLTANVDAINETDFVKPGKRPYPQNQILEKLLNWHRMRGRTAREVAEIHKQAVERNGGESKITIIPADLDGVYPSKSDLNYHIAVVEKETV